MTFLFITVILLIMLKSLHHFLFHKEMSFMNKKMFVLEIFLTFMIVYSILIIGFGLVYFILSFSGDVFINQQKSDDASLNRLLTSIYFSGVTLLTIGYGDVSPVGVVRFLAVIQAMLGYALPSLLVLRLLEMYQLLARNR
ncbi:MAG: two pore domain potassium channel family protein [Bacilli bacterium]|nr:two pore domain potassium channel family protein [Bacilli bacterium]